MDKHDFNTTNSVFGGVKQMADQKWDELGERVSGIVDDAVKEQNYSSLNETISRILNDAIDSGTDALRSVINSTLGTDSRPGAEGRSQTGRSPSGAAQQDRTWQQGSFIVGGQRQGVGTRAVLDLIQYHVDQIQTDPVKHDPGDNLVNVAVSL